MIRPEVLPNLYVIIILLVVPTSPAGTARPPHASGRQPVLKHV
jgi:hypothetical protein